MWLFKEHPESVGETYTEHMGVAFSFGSKMVVAGFACLLHGLFPFLFTRTGSRTIGELHDRMVVNRIKQGAHAPATAVPLPTSEAR